MDAVELVFSPLSNVILVVIIVPPTRVLCTSIVSNWAPDGCAVVNVARILVSVNARGALNVVNTVVEPAVSAVV